MTSRTRSRVTFCLILGLLTLPAEALLLPVARTPKADEAALEWAADLSAAQLRGGRRSRSMRIPLVYRKRAAHADERGRSFRCLAHVSASLPARTSRPDARTDRVRRRGDRAAVVRRLRRRRWRRTSRNRSARSSTKRSSLLGNQNAEELFVTLGPEETAARQRAAVHAAVGATRSAAGASSTPSIPDCNCNIDIDTCDIWPEDDWLQCSEMYTCNFDLSWPMCGPFWSWACTGWCKIISFPTSEMF